MEKCLPVMDSLTPTTVEPEGAEWTPAIHLRQGFGETGEANRVTLRLAWMSQSVTRQGAAAYLLWTRSVSAFSSARQALRASLKPSVVMFPLLR